MYQSCTITNIYQIASEKSKEEEEEEEEYYKLFNPLWKTCSAGSKFVLQLEWFAGTFTSTDEDIPVEGDIKFWEKKPQSFLIDKYI